MIFTQSSSSIANRLDPRTKLLISFIFFTLLVYLSQLNQILLILLFIISLSLIAQGIKSTLLTLWYFKWYLILLVLFFVLYSSNQMLVVITLLKLVGFILSFVLLSKSTNADQLVDALIKLRLPPSLAWNIGVAIRQATFLIDEITHILVIQRQRILISQTGKLAHFKHRIFEVSLVLQSLISRSIVISTDFTDALQARNYQKPNREIITYTSKLTYLDAIFIFTHIVLPLTILTLIRHQFFMV